VWDKGGGMEETIEETRTKLKVSEATRLNMENEINMLRIRVKMLEKQNDLAVSILDNIVPILFQERFGQQELQGDMMFKTFRQLRKILDRKELGMPQSMSKDYKSPIYG
jgi:hypothetical protein